MNIYPKNQYIPYTYLIGWSDHNIWYYGSEYSSKGKIANPNNLWTIYFTSSKHVEKFREKYGEPDIIEIRKTFINEELTRIWEHKVLKKLNASKEEKWLNKSDGSLNSLNSEERSKISKERMADPEIKARIMKSQKLTMNTPEYKQKRKQIAKEIWSRQETKLKRKITDSKPEIIQLKSQIQKEAQNRPEVKAKKSKIGKHIQNKPEVRDKKIKSLIKHYNSLPSFYCPYCKRNFKGENAWINHLKSVKHLKNSRLNLMIAYILVHVLPL